MKNKFNIFKCGVKCPVIYILIILGLILIDQGIKMLATNMLKGSLPIHIVDDLFSLKYTENTGAAFSMLSGQRGILTIVPIAIILFSVWYMIKRSKSYVLDIGIMLLVGGGAGNLIDRINKAYVVDYLNLHGFAIFNLADIFVCIGCGLILLWVIFLDKEQVSYD